MEATQLSVLSLRQREGTLPHQETAVPHHRERRRLCLEELTHSVAQEEQVATPPLAAQVQTAVSELQRLCRTHQPQALPQLEEWLVLQEGQIQQAPQAWAVLDTTVGVVLEVM